MFRTKKGQNFIERSARHTKRWSLYGSFAVTLCVIVMAVAMVLIVWNLLVIPSIPKERAPPPQLLLGIPGVNPIIPVGYGIFGLAVAIAVHEFSHAILARVCGIKLKSLGLLVCIVPIGAFAEPDEEELNKLPKLKRARIFAVGPTSNILIAIICALLFSVVFMGSVVPKERDGVVVTACFKDSIGVKSGLKYGMQIIEVNGTVLHSPADFATVPAPSPLQKFDFTKVIYNGKRFALRNVTSGVVITGILSDSPAAKSGLKPNYVFHTINGSEIKNYNDFTIAMANTVPNQTINITVYSPEGGGYRHRNLTVTLASKYDFYARYYPSENKAEYKKIGFLGVGCAFLGVGVANVNSFSEQLAHPFKGTKSIEDFAKHALVYISLPLLGLAPLQEPITPLYKPAGILAFMPDAAFWLIANTLYWVFWLNIMVGLTNALPAVPLDGGYMYRDGVKYTLQKIRPRWTDKKIDNVAKSISYLTALFILVVIVMQILVPRLVGV